MNSFRLAVTQMTSSDNLAGNLEQLERLYAAAHDADLVVFPENTLFFRVRSGSRIQALNWEGPEVQRLQSLVERGHKPLMLTTAIQAESSVRNVTALFTPGGVPRQLYAKIHMFDVDVIGAPPVRESDHFVRGEKPAVVEINGWKFGLSICYDLRFAELYLHYAQQVDVILIPSAFLVPTGEAHWHTLVRARAIEAQCFVAAPAQSGAHRSGSEVRHTYGHALMVDPWGKVLAELSDSPEVQVIELQREALEKVRRQIPMGGHRRL
jgi:predicted amidohydrolase